MKPYYQRAGWRRLPAVLTIGGVPDLTDPATQGAALAVLREVRGCILTVRVTPHAATIEWAREPQHSGSGMSTYSTTAPTLAAALAAALTVLIPE